MPTVTITQKRRSLQIQRPISRRFSPAEIKLVEDDAAILSAGMDSSEGEAMDISTKKSLRETMVKNALRRSFTT